MKKSLPSKRQADSNENVFYSTLCAMSSTILAIFMAFVIAYVIYTKEKQDELSIDIQKELQDLNLMFHRYSNLGEYRGRPYLYRPTNHSLIMEEETWDKSASNLFDDEVKAIDEEYNKVAIKYKGDFPNSAVFNLVKMHIQELVKAIYRELPSPPGIIRKEGVVTHFEKLIRDDFPACEREFLKWAIKFQDFTGEVSNVYVHLLPTFGIMQEINEKEMDQSIAMLETLKRTGRVDDGLYDALRISTEYFKSEGEHYYTFFLSLNSLANKATEITRTIKYYCTFQENAVNLAL